MKTYNETLHWIHELLGFGIKPGLVRMESMLKQLGHPETKLRAVHVAGTNGKGSTVTYLRCCLETAGYQVGTFTSPYMNQFNDRISINGVPISNEDLVKVANEVRPTVDKVAATELGTPTEFEVVTMLAIVYFSKYASTDVVLFETGLGGRLDSTNVIQPILTGITNVGHDHMAILGSTLPEIAFEKSGILKAEVPLVTGVEQEEALQVLINRSRELKVPSFRLNKEYMIINQQPLDEGEQFTLQTPLRTYHDLKIGMIGNHQVKNASMAVVLLELLVDKYNYKVELNHIQQGLLTTHWPGRFEKISDRPVIILDGAHNKEGMESLKETLMAHYPTQKKRLVFSALADKSVNDMLSILYNCVDHIMFTSFDFPRASSARALYEACEWEQKDKDLEADFKKALLLEQKRTMDNDVLVITGSLYFISRVRKHLMPLT